jgi:hypothetical protein
LRRVEVLEGWNNGVRVGIFLNGSLRRNKKFTSDFNESRPVQPSGKKYLCFVFSEFVVICPHPASSRGALRAIVTTREAGMRWTLRLRKTNATEADVKSCGPGIPTLMPSATRASALSRHGGQKARCTEEITYKR